MYGGGGFSIPGIGGGNDIKAGRNALYGISICCILVGITGCVLLPIGISQQVTAGKYDPSADFQLIAGGCLITGASHSTFEEGNGKTGGKKCVDRFEYAFLRNNQTGLEYRSEAEDHKRDGDCGGSSIMPRDHTDGETVSCWEPTGVASVAELDEFYKCGFPGCLKLIDPASEFGNASANARLFLILGACLLLLGSSCTCCICRAASYAGSAGESSFLKPILKPKARANGCWRLCSSC